MPGKQKVYNDDFREEEIIGPDGKTWYKDVRNGGVSPTPHVESKPMKAAERSADKTYVNRATGQLETAKANTANSTVGGGLAGGVAAAAARSKPSPEPDETEEEKKRKEEERRRRLGAKGQVEALRQQ